MEVETDGGLIP